MVSSPDFATTRRRQLALTIALWLAFVAITVALGGRRVAELSLSTDDYTRVVQARGLLEGRGWFDHRESRFNTPAGIDMHWTRLPDVPLAITMLAGEVLADRDGATVAALLALPALYALAFIFLLVVTCRRVIGRPGWHWAVSWSALAALSLGDFNPGRVDHHGLQLISMLVLLSSVLRVCLDTRDVRAAVVAGLAVPVSLWIGLETMPYVATTFVLAAAAYVVLGARASEALTRFSMAVAGSAVAVFVLAIPASGYLSAGACDSYSSRHLLVLLVASGCTGAMGYLARRLDSQRSRTGSFALLALVGCGLAAVAYWSCLAGPYGDIDPAVRTVWLDHVRETQSLVETASRNPPQLIAGAGAAIAGWVVATALLVRRTDLPRAPILVIWAFLCAALAVSVWEIRGLRFASTFAVAPLAVAAIAAGRRAAALRLRIARAPAIAIVILLLNPMSFVLGSLFLDDVQTASSSATSTACVLPEELVGESESRRIMTYIDLGPRIVFHTQHEVVGAPYHRNSDGIRDVIRFFTGDETSAHEIATARRIELVFICPSMVETTLYQPAGEHTFIDQLLAGRPPPWLEPIPADGGAAGGALFRVR